MVLGLILKLCTRLPGYGTRKSRASMTCGNVETGMVLEDCTVGKIYPCVRSTPFYPRVETVLLGSISRRAGKYRDIWRCAKGCPTNRAYHQKPYI